jgi:hypothetical protein
MIFNILKLSLLLLVIVALSGCKPYYYETYLTAFDYGFTRNLLNDEKINPRLEDQFIKNDTAVEDDASAGFWLNPTREYIETKHEESVIYKEPYSIEYVEFTIRPVLEKRQKFGILEDIEITKADFVILNRDGTRYEQSILSEQDKFDFKYNPGVRSRRSFLYSMNAEEGSKREPALKIFQELVDRGILVVRYASQKESLTSGTGAVAQDAFVKQGEITEAESQAIWAILKKKTVLNERDETREERAIDQENINRWLKGESDNVKNHVLAILEQSHVYFTGFYKLSDYWFNHTDQLLEALVFIEEDKRQQVYSILKDLRKRFIHVKVLPESVPLLNEIAANIRDSKVKQFTFYAEFTGIYEDGTRRHYECEDSTYYYHAKRKPSLVWKY